MFIALEWKIIFCVCDVHVSECVHTKLFKVCLTAVGIEPATFGCFPSALPTELLISKELD